MHYQYTPALTDGTFRICTRKNTKVQFTNLCVFGPDEQPIVVVRHDDSPHPNEIAASTCVTNSHEVSIARLISNYGGEYVRALSPWPTGDSVFFSLAVTQRPVVIHDGDGVTLAAHPAFTWTSNDDDLRQAIESDPTFSGRLQFGYREMQMSDAADVAIARLVDEDRNGGASLATKFEAALALPSSGATELTDVIKEACEILVTSDKEERAALRFLTFNCGLPSEIVRYAVEFAQDNDPVAA